MVINSKCHPELWMAWVSKQSTKIYIRCVMKYTHEMAVSESFSGVIKLPYQKA